MPINEQVLDALSYLMDHYFADHPAATNVSAGDLAVYAVYAEAHACDGCVARFTALVGVARGAPGRGGGRDEGQLPEIFTE